MKVRESKKEKEDLLSDVCRSCYFKEKCFFVDKKDCQGTSLIYNKRHLPGNSYIMLNKKDKLNSISV